MGSATACISHAAAAGLVTNAAATGIWRLLSCRSDGFSDDDDDDDDSTNV